ncbi:MAG TPA: acetate--CoA ligase [Thermodesulfobacteriota bacterium]|nr:acetate--CoA ligase [Thermodesulfobacteriota bacterium]
MENILPPANPKANLEDYEKAHRSFDWKVVEQEFSWHHTGKVNIAYEAIDRHAEDPIQAGKCCLNFEGESRKERISYAQMKDLSNRFANVLRKIGVKKGDRVLIFLPRCPEYYVAMVGCAKVGAIFCPLFEALMQVALGERLRDSGAKVLVSNLKMAEQVPLIDLPSPRSIILVGAMGMGLKPWELSWEEEMVHASPECRIEWVSLEDPLYLIYTYGSSGKPKGVLHAHQDMVGHLITARWVLDLREGDVLWTTADPGWVTGTVYGAFAPWLCGVESFIRAGRFEMEGWCRSIEMNRVSVWYTAPTVFRRFIGRGEEVLKRHDLSSLRHLLSVGEPLPSEIVYWARRVFKMPIHDTWWMTETGMIMIANYPSMPIKPGSIGKPFPGTKAAILGSHGEELPPMTLGSLALQKGWPAMMRQIWKDEKRHQEYFRFPSWYISGDTAYMDDDGYFYYQGRDDDLIKIAGVVVGPTEVEEVLRRHPAIADAGIIGKTDSMKGNIIKAFICLRPGFAPSEDLKSEIKEFVKKYFSPRIVPKEVDFRPQIPRSEDGKVVRRVLKAWELGLPA